MGTRIPIIGIFRASDASGPAGLAAGVKLGDEVAFFFLCDDLKPAAVRAGGAVYGSLDLVLAEPQLQAIAQEGRLLERPS